MGQEPDEIRRDIEDTRARMGETVDALGYKTDVKARASDFVSEKKDAVVSRVSGTVPDTGEVRRGARRAAGVAQQNPLGLAVAGAAVGFLAGMLVPSTRVEDERLGEMSDQLKERARETGQEAFERGRQVAQDVAETAKETAKESGKQQSEELSSTLRDSAHERASGPPGPQSAA